MHPWLMGSQLIPPATSQHPTCGVPHWASGRQPALHWGAPPSEAKRGQYQALEPFSAWHWASEVQPVGAALHWPEGGSQTFPAPQSALLPHGPQNPPTQARPPQLLASVQGCRGTQAPAWQFSPLRHWVLLVHGPHAPGLPGSQTGVALPWQSRLL